MSILKSRGRHGRRSRNGPHGRYGCSVRRGHRGHRGRHGPHDHRFRCVRVAAVATMTVVVSMAAMIPMAAVAPKSLRGKVISYFHDSRVHSPSPPRVFPESSPRPEYKTFIYSAKVGQDSAQTHPDLS